MFFLWDPSAFAMFFSNVLTKLRSDGIGPFKTGKPIVRGMNS